MKIKRRALTGMQKKKVKTDLEFLEKVLAVAGEEKMRVVVVGGYGLDGVLGKITRPHNDIEMVVYSQIARTKARKLWKNLVLTLFPEASLEIKENQFMVTIDLNACGFGAQLYLVETQDDPYVDLHTLKLKSGIIHTNDRGRFPNPVKGGVDGIEFEVQDPNAHLADILWKRKRDGMLSKHDQDIDNLKLITQVEKVDCILAKNG